MSYANGQLVKFSRLGQGKRNDARIHAREIDNPEMFIDTPNARGNFDYLIEREKDGITKRLFCQEFEISL
jgi:hypothetical protein